MDWILTYNPAHATKDAGIFIETATACKEAVRKYILENSIEEDPSEIAVLVMADSLTTFKTFPWLRKIPEALKMAKASHLITETGMHITFEEAEAMLKDGSNSREVAERLLKQFQLAKQINNLEVPEYIADDKKPLAVTDFHKAISAESLRREFQLKALSSLVLQHGLNFDFREIAEKNPVARNSLVTQRQYFIPHVFSDFEGDKDPFALTLFDEKIAGYKFSIGFGEKEIAAEKGKPETRKSIYFPLFAMDEEVLSLLTAPIKKGDEKPSYEAVVCSSILSGLRTALSLASHDWVHNTIFYNFLNYPEKTEERKVRLASTVRPAKTQSPEARSWADNIEFTHHDKVGDIGTSRVEAFSFILNKKVWDKIFANDELEERSDNEPKRTKGERTKDSLLGSFASLFDNIRRFGEILEKQGKPAEAKKVRAYLSTIAFMQLSLIIPYDSPDMEKEVSFYSNNPEKKGEKSKGSIAALIDSLNLPNVTVRVNSDNLETPPARVKKRDFASKVIANEEGNPSGINRIMRRILTLGVNANFFLADSELVNNYPAAELAAGFARSFGTLENTNPSLAEHYAEARKLMAEYFARKDFRDSGNKGAVPER